MVVEHANNSADANPPPNNFPIMIATLFTADIVKSINYARAMCPLCDRRRQAGTSNLLVPEAADEMIVDHPGRLHMSIDDSRADEVEATLLHVFAQTIG